MPVKLREFYWNELLNAKEQEKNSYEDIINKSPSNRNSVARRK
jgi:hypothetical protein